MLLNIHISKACNLLLIFGPYS